MFFIYSKLLKRLNDIVISWPEHKCLENYCYSAYVIVVAVRRQKC